MRIIMLEKLQPGDVILETGMRRVAEATAGPYGHASIALGGLAKIEAGKEEGVVIGAFDIRTFSRGDERVVGHAMDGDAVVLRHASPPELAELDANSLAEAGREYSLSKALELPDITASGHALARRAFGERVNEPEPDGRICSEVAARILGLPDTVVSPNALANDPNLKPVPGALVTLGPDWTSEGARPELGAIGQLIAEIEPGLALRAMAALRETAAAIKRGEATGEEAGPALEAEFGAEIERSVTVLHELRKLESEILHSGGTAG